jgi:hypothetical protein
VASWPRTAKGAPFELAWSAPEGCPSHDEIVEATLGRLGVARSDASPELFVRGTVVADGGGFVVTLALADASGHSIGEREVRAEQPTCQAIKEPAALVLAMMIAVARVDEHHEPAETVEVTPRPTSTQPRPSTPPTTTPYSVTSYPQRLLLGAMGVGSIGILPEPGIGLALRATYAPKSNAVGLEFSLETTFETSSAVRAAGGVIGFQLFTASVRMGLSALRTTIFDLVPTLSAREALIRTSPAGFTAVRNQLRSTPLLGAGLVIRAQIRPHFFMEALPEVEGVLLRDRFQIRDGDKLYHIHRAGPIEGRFSLGVGYEFR